MKKLLLLLTILLAGCGDHIETTFTIISVTDSTRCDSGNKLTLFETTEGYRRAQCANAGKAGDSFKGALVRNAFDHYHNRIIY
jgi:hypothetical protein